MFDFVKRVFLGLVHSVGAVFVTNREAVVESGDGYIRYSNGIQLCWGTATLNGPVTATNKRIYFPQAFKSGTVTVYTTHDTNVERALADVGWVSNTAFLIGTLVILCYRGIKMLIQRMMPGSRVQDKTTWDLGYTNI